jgi:hypothetical protein
MLTGHQIWQLAFVWTFKNSGWFRAGLTPEFFGFTGGVPNDHWVIVAAQANLHPSNDICKYVATSIFASGSSGEDPGMQLGFVEINTNLNP